MVEEPESMRTILKVVSVFFFKLLNPLQGLLAVLIVLNIASMFR